MKPIDIGPSDLGTVRRVLREHVPGLEVWAFGSRVSWTARGTSDLDIALMTTEPLDAMRLAEMREAFVQSDLPFRVDIVDWSPTSKFFRRVIEQDHVMLVGKDRHNEWNETLFVNCATLVSEKVSPSEMGDVPYIGLGHIDEDTLSLRSHGIASDVTSTKTRFKRGDILFGKLRPYFRKVIMAPFDGVCSTDIWVVRPLNGIDVRFLFYKMASQEFVHVATQGSEGTRMPRAKWEFVSRMSCLIPPLPEQRAIAHVLGVLDDKIELSRQMNRTLEEMARALFKSWFVDFEPVRAKMDDRWRPGESLPGLPAQAWEQCCVGRGVATLRHKSGSRSFTYYSIWPLQRDLKQYEQMGTVFGAITKKQFEMLKIIEPTANLVDCFETCVMAWDERIRSNTSESRTLTAQRDALMPKLISGELLVKNAITSIRKEI